MLVWQTNGTFPQCDWVRVQFQGLWIQGGTGSSEKKTDLTNLILHRALKGKSRKSLYVKMKTEVLQS